MTGQHFSPVSMTLFVAFLGFALYRRYRRTVGRQPLVPRRLTFQVGFLGIVILLFLAPLLGRPQTAAAALAGLLVGGLVAVGGLSLTKFERTADRDYYTPNTYLGLAVLGVFLARLAFRFTQVSAVLQAPPVGGQTVPPNLGSLASSPITAALLLMVLGYYLVYEGGLLRWYRRNPPVRSIP